eukprot:COSAG02_NODE_66937_length_254_cov_0.664516_1_plen_38_part_01
MAPISLLLLLLSLLLGTPSSAVLRRSSLVWTCDPQLSG